MSLWTNDARSDDIDLSTLTITVTYHTIDIPIEQNDQKVLIGKVNLS